MPFSGSAGSKTYSRTDGTRSGSQTWQEADGAGVDIIASDHDTHDQDLADAINSLLMKDGGNTATANLPMGGFRHTNAGAASARTDYARFSDLQDGKGIYCPTVGGTGNAITLTSGYSVSAYAAGQRFSFIVGTTNTGAVTVNIDSQGAKTIARNDASHTALAAGDLQAGAFADIEYDGTRFKLVSASANGTSADVLARIVKVGSVLPWPMTTVPSGWLECDGSAVSRTTYAELYSVLGTAYGVGDGSTTFNLPNYQDYFLRGFDASGADAASRTDRGDGTTGASVGTKQAGAVVAHTHTGTTGAGSAHKHGVDIQLLSTVNAGAGSSGRLVTQANTDTTNESAHTHTFTTDSTGGTETRPKNITVKFIILALPAAASASTLGVNGLLYTWDTGTSDADPGSGKLRVNNATIASATQIYINETGANGEGLANVLATWDDSTNATKGDLYIYKVGTPSTFAYFQVTGSITDAGSYDKFSLTYVGNNGTFANGDNVSVIFFRSGNVGATGAAGDSGIKFTFSTTTTMADPGAGIIRFNNATLSSVTAIAVDDASAESGNPDVSAAVLSWDDSSTTSNRGTLTIKKTSATENFAVYTISGASTDNSGWTQLAVTHVTSSGSFSNSDTLSVAFTRTGDVGSSGTDGITPGIQFTYSSTTTDSDPGAGTFRLNNATLSSVTAAYVDNTDSNSNDVTGWLDSFDDGNDTTRRGDLIIQDVSAPSNYALYRVTGSVVDGTGYRKLTLSHLSSAGTLAGLCVFKFSMAGDKGAAGAGSGDLLSTNNLSDVANASTARTNLGVGTADSPQFAAINLGHASDTTLARVSAGVVSIEGVNIVTETGTQTLTNKTFTAPALGTPASGTLTNCTGLPVAGIAASTSTALGVGSVELGHATDTTLARVSAGVVSIEGVNIVTVSATQTLTNKTLTSPTLTTPALGTPASGTLTNCTGLPVSTGISGLGTGVGTWLATPSVTNLNSALTGGPVLAAGTQEWFIPAANFAPRTSNGCAALATLETSTNKVNLPYLAFDATTQEFAQTIVPRMPKSWNESTITAIVVHTHPSTTTNFGVVWGVSALALSDDDAADTAFGTAQTTTDTGGTTNDIYHSPATSAITIGNSPAEGDTIVIQVSRNPSDGSDTMAVKAYFLGLLIRITTNAANDA